MNMHKSTLLRYIAILAFFLFSTGLSLAQVTPKALLPIVVVKDMDGNTVTDLSFGDFTYGTTPLLSKSIKISGTNLLSLVVNLTLPNNYSFDANKKTTSQTIIPLLGGISDQVFTIYFRPESLKASYEGNFTILGGGLNLAVNTSLHATCMPKLLVKDTNGLDVTSLAFGNYIYGDALPVRTIKVNGLNITSNVTLTLPNDFSFDASSVVSVKTLAPVNGVVAQQSYTVYFKPSSIKASYTGNLQITGNDITGGYNIPLSATCTPNLSVMENQVVTSALIWGKCAYGVPVSKVITLSGVNLSPATSGTLTVSVSGAAYSSSTTTVAIDANGKVSATLPVVYTPVLNTVSSGTLSISGGGMSSPVQVSLSGEGYNPVVVPTVIDFGDVPVGTTPSEMVVITATNLVGNLSVADVTGQLHQSVLTKISNTEYHLTVALQAPSTQSYLGSVAVSGTGITTQTIQVKANMGVTQLTVDPGSLDFGAVRKGFPSTLEVVVKGRFLPTSVSVTTATNDVSVLPSSLTQSDLLSAQGAKVLVAYKPSLYGDMSGTVVFNCGNYTKVLPMTGTSNNLRPSVVLSENFGGFTQGLAGGNSDGSATTDDVAANLDDYTGMKGWSGTLIYQNGGATKVGDDLVRGSLSTPMLDLSANNGVFTLQFNAKAWAGDAQTLNVYVNGTLYVADQLPNALNTAFKSYTLNLSGGNDATTIRFEGGQQTGAAFILGDVTISQNKPTTLVKYTVQELGKMYFISMPFDVNVSTGIQRADGRALSGLKADQPKQNLDDFILREYSTANRAQYGSIDPAWGSADYVKNPYQDITLADNTLMKAGQGYVFRLSSDVSKNFVAPMDIYFESNAGAPAYPEALVVQEANVTTNALDGSLHDSWNLIGVPYPSAYTLTRRSFYLDANSPGGVSVYSFNGVDYTIANTRLKNIDIPANGSFFIQSGEYEKVYFNKAVSRDVEVRSDEATETVLEIFMSDNTPGGVKDETILWFDPQAYTEKYEVNRDAVKMFGTARPQIFSRSFNTSLAINYRLFPESGEQIALSYVADVREANYTIGLTELTRVEGYDVTLTDNRLGVTTNLSRGTYSFTEKGSGKTVSNRFAVSLAPQTPTGIETSTHDEIRIWTEDGLLYALGVPADSRISVSDIFGKLVAAPSAEMLEKGIMVIPGMIIVSVTGQHQTYSRKIQIR